jgi:G:T-mismatch repair DNA endonuclease (very short patch repair protein)
MKKGQVMSEEQKQKISRIRKRLFKSGKLINYWKGKHLSEEAKRKMSDTRKKEYQTGTIINPNKGKKLSEEHKQKISETRKERFRTGKIVNYWKNKKLPEEVRRKISETRKKRHREGTIVNPNKGKAMSKEQKEKLSETHKLAFQTGTRTAWNKGKICPQFAGENNAFYGKQHTSKTKELISKLHSNKPLSEAHRRKISIIVRQRLETPEGKQSIKKAQIASHNKRQDTKIELKIQDLLKQLGFKFEKRRHMIEIPEQEYFCDIFIPSLNLVIECNGEYWHASETIFKNEDTKHPGMNKTIKEVRRDEKIRIERFLKQGFKVLVLWEREIKRMNSEVLQKRIEEILKVNS